MRKLENGIVGFFDIMGYQSIIDNNKIDIVADIISDVIEKLPDETRSDMLKKFRAPSAKVKDKDKAKTKLILRNIVEHVKTLLISDSVVVSLVFSKRVTTKKILNDFKLLHWMFFFFFTRLFLRKAFSKGLPLRAAIDTGDYFIRKNIFAGKPIINAYRLSGRLQFSGCALTPNATKEIDKLLKETKIRKFDALFNLEYIPYLAPLSDKDEKLYLIDWFSENLDNRDIRQEIVTAFHAHNKDVPRKVLPVIKNTEKIIKHSISRRLTFTNNEDV